MEPRRINQFRQSISKYKILSSNAGVGSIVSTKWGGFIMPLTSSSWKFITVITDYFKDKNQSDIVDYKQLSSDTGVEFVEDTRFVDFLRNTEDLKNLRCLLAIPRIELQWDNSCDLQNQPTNKHYKEEHSGSAGLEESMFTVPAIVFPRWFYSKRNFLFKNLEDWEHLWIQKGCNDGKKEYFAPPRDPFSPQNRKHTDPWLKDNRVYEPLEQVGMVLICPNGHIADIPWLNYFCAKYNKETLLNAEGFDLFNYDTDSCKCIDNKQHELQWLENRNRAESFGTLKCKLCGKSVSLEGIMNLQPLCPGHRPWEGVDVKETKSCMQDGKRCTMKWALVTSNSVYYAENFSSLYIPDNYIGTFDMTNIGRTVFDLMKKIWYPKYQKKHPEATEEIYIEECRRELIDKAEDAGLSISEKEMESVIKNFLPHTEKNEDRDPREDFRFKEYSVFVNHAMSLPKTEEKLKFADIKLPKEFVPFFDKIQQVEVLALSCTQINFSRVQMPQPRVVNGKTKYPNSMKIFKGKPEDVYAMPATQTFGEGLFFGFNRDSVKEWNKTYATDLNFHYKSDERHESLYDSLYYKMKQGGIANFYLLHTFSHILMKELEFSCGYPTASLQERLYFSDRMCGVLIYTADGSEGSMGGLVWQGQPTLIGNIIKSALQRALDCSSDPICWENEDQLNHAACFSCAMVSETSCEERNMGLDRRILVDEKFGFFKHLISNH